MTAVPSPRRKTSRQVQYLPATLLMGAGIFLLGLLGYVAETQIQKYQRLEFQRHVDIKFASMEKTLSGIQGALHALTAFMTTVETPEHFEAFARALHVLYPEIKVLSWNPVVTGEERKAFEAKGREARPGFAIRDVDAAGHLHAAPSRRMYVPVQFVVPALGNQAVLGLDILSEQRRRTAVEKAIATRRMAVTPRMQLVQSAECGPGISLMNPVYAHEGEAGSRGDLPVGFVAGALCLDKLIENALKSPGAAEMIVALAGDDSSSGPPPPAFSGGTDNPRVADLSGGKHPGSRFLVTKDFRVGDRTWRLLISPKNPAWPIAPSAQPLAIVLTGFMLVLVSSAYLMFQIKKSTDSEFLAVQSAEDMETALMELGREVEERKRIQDSLTRQAAELADQRSAALTLLEDAEEARKLAVEAGASLEESERSYRDLFEAAHDSIFITDAQTRRFLTVNEIGAKRLGYSKEELLRMTPFDINVPGEDALREALGRLWAEGHILVETIHRRKDGSHLPVEVSARIIEYQGRKAVLSYVRDTTEREKSRLALEAAKRAAEDANQAKSEFLANISHEIRTPLNGVLGMTSLLLETPLSETQKDYLLTAKSSGEHLLALINQILDFSKIEHGGFELDIAPFDLPALLEASCLLLSAQSREKGLGLHVQISPMLPRVFSGDPLRIRQILLNLLANAVKFSDRGDIQVHVSGERGQEGKWRLDFQVSDQGPGMADAVLEKIFQPFQQGDPSLTRKSGGTGLGLAICKNLVEKMGGEIHVTSRLGKGSTFRFTLPLFESGLEETPEQKKAPVSAARGAHASPFSARGGAQLQAETAMAWLSPPHILVADDHPVNVEVAASMLQRLGCHVHVAQNGSEAISAHERNVYDLILMDLQMPEIDGFTATRRIREAEAGRRRTPIVALTAHAVSGDREKCLAADMDDYLSKPLSAQALKSVLLNRISPGGDLDWSRLEAIGNAGSEGRQRISALVRLFHETTEDSLNTLRNQISEDDQQGLRHSLHRLKGACAAVGASSMYGLIDRWEKHSEPGKAVSLLLMTELEGSFARAAAAMEERFGVPAPPFRGGQANVQ